VCVCLCARAPIPYDVLHVVYVSSVTCFHRCLLIIEYASATHPYTYLCPSVELRERFCSIVRNARCDAPPVAPRILLGSWNLGEWTRERGGGKVGADQAVLLDWILAGNSSRDSDSVVSDSSNHDVYVLCLQGRFQENSIGDDFADIGSCDGEVAAQLLSLLGPQFVVAARVVGAASTIIVACQMRLMPHVTNIEVFEGSSGVQDGPGTTGGFVISGEPCAVSLCIAEASFLFLNWPAVLQPSSGAGGLSLGQIDAMVNLDCNI